MAGCFTFLLVALATAASVAESRAVPAEPISLMMDSYGNPVMVLREKRTAPYPQRAMMFTGYYRPVRRSNGQATGVFAQGNSVSGEAFFGGMRAPHLQRGPEPIEEPEISSAEAQASPEDPSFTEEEEEAAVQEHSQEEEHHEHHEHHEEHHHEPEEHHHHEENDQRDQHHHHEPHTPHVPHEHHEPEPTAFTTEPSAVPSAEDAIGSTEVSANRPKTRPGKKTKKTPVVVEEDDDEDEEEDDEPVVPFVPFKGTKRRQNYPHLNNFFPMVFSFPGVASRAGSSGSPPGAVTAIANSYSTGKGGVASSVATAYGGSPNGKKRRTTPSEE